MSTDQEKTEKQYKKDLLNATLNAARAPAITMLCARLFGKRHAMWKTEYGGRVSVYRLAKWRGNNYLLGAMDV